MIVGNRKYETIWLDEENPRIVKVIDQTKLPFSFGIRELRSVDDVYNAIDDMTVRGAPLIGAAAAFGMYLAALEINGSVNPAEHLSNAAGYLASCRPTAVNLSWAVGHVLSELKDPSRKGSLPERALSVALEICETEKENCRKLGINGLKLIEDMSRQKHGARVNILTHCNAGWLACIDYGTATAPIYFAKEKGIDIHVWVDETRPRNQGSKLTAWELGQNGIPYTLVTDNTGGHLMQHGMVDMVMVGCDRATRRGDAANKIGTYLKALAACDNKLPFYVVLPSTSIDFSIRDGLSEIQIEERDADEVKCISGISGGELKTVQICPDDAEAVNFGFDVTPARLITGLVTERGICRADEEDIKKLFPDKF